MAKGATIEKLFLSLGLDMTQLDSDLITASKTVNQGMSDLKTKTQQAKIRMEIDMAQFKGAENSTEALAAKTKHLTDQLNIQKQAVALMDAAYAESVATKGKDDAVSQRILTRLLREQRAEADLAAQIRQTNAVRASNAVIPVASAARTTTNAINAVAPVTNSAIVNAATEAVNGFNTRLGRLKEAGQSAGSAILALNTKMIGMAAAFAGGYGLFQFVKSVVDAGDAAYKLSVRMNLTATEASGLNRMLGMAGVEADPFIKTMTRLDKSVLSAGKNGNALTDSMKLFGFSLTDASGSLLPMNQQLEQLAIGYRNAAKAEEETAFVAEVLGTKGEALIPLLKEYSEIKEVASRTKLFGGIDPKEAHEAALQFKVLNAEAGQFKNVLGVALMPVVKELMPVVEDGLGSAITSLKENKEEIINTVKSGIELVKTTKEIGSEIANITKFVFNISGIYSANDALKELQVEMQMIKNHPLIGTASAVGNMLGFGGLPSLVSTLGGYKEEAKEEEAIERGRNAIKKSGLAERQKIADQDKKTAEAQANAVVQAQKKQMESAKANAKAQIELADEVYKSTHTAMENELHDIDVKKQKMIDTDGVDEVTAVAIAEARKKMIIDKNNKEIQKSVEDMDNQIYKLTHSSLENRLRDIEIERKAWIDKTHDEVKATQLAEQEKAKAVKDAIDSQLGEEIRAVKAAILAGKDKYTALKEAQEKMALDKSAETEARDLVKREHGVYEAGDTRRTTVVDGNNAYQISEIVKEFSGVISTLSKFEQYKAEQIASGAVTNTVTISVPVTATINSDADINVLADQVADKIKTPILNALGGDDNSY